MIFEEIHVSVDKGAFIYIIPFRHLSVCFYIIQCAYNYFLIYILEKFNRSFGVVFMVDYISAYMPYKSVEIGKEEVACAPPPPLYLFIFSKMKYVQCLWPQISVFRWTC